MNLDNNTRMTRKEYIENALLDGFSPPNIKNESGYATIKAAEELGITHRTLKRWLAYEEEMEEAGLINYLPRWNLYNEKKKLIEYEEQLANDVPIEELLDMLGKRNRKRLDSARQRAWQTIKINTNEPVVIAFVGDPHLDDNGCDIELLRSHVNLMNKKNVFAINIGDTTNNWVGNLMRLYKDQDTSISTARRLVDWFLNDSGITWLAWVMGNHDLWEHGAAITKLMNTKQVLMEDWSCRIKIEFPSGLEVPLWLAHDFKGRSQFSKVHGAVKAARERRGAAIYVCGHTHDAGYYTEEHPDTGELLHALRVRGYKFNDEHALVNGFSESRHGATMAAVIDPKAKTLADAITIFYDLEKAVIFKEALE